MTSYEGSGSPSESFPESAGELVRTGPLAVTGGDRMRSGGSSLIPLSGDVAELQTGGGAFSNPLRLIRRLAQLGRPWSFLIRYSIASAMSLT